MIMQWVALVFSLIALAASASANDFIVGSTYSCFTGFQSVSTDGCKSRVEDAEGNIVQEASANSDTDFCVSQLIYGQAKQGSFGKSKNYAVSATFKMVEMGKYSTSYGYLGIAFNMMDSNNYDIAYVRPHAKDHCWELGYIEDGMLFGRGFGTCNDKVMKEFNLAIKIENGRGELYVNGGKEKDFTPFFPPVNKVATALRSNMVAQMTVKNLKLCHEIKCVSRNEAGRTQVTAPGDSYRDASMSKCEACVCGIYGQIRCGCLPAEEQGVSCTGGKISAVGKDCCARCVPPKGTCKVYGDPHYTTFDGKGFLYQGDCTYCIMKTNDFEVQVKNQDRGTVSITEYCYLNFDGDEYRVGKGSLMLKEAGETVSRVVATPFKKYYTTEDYVYCSSYISCKLFIGGTEMLDLMCKFYYLTIQLHGTYYERTDCICGNWDGNAANDWTTKDGQLVNNANDYANSYQVHNSGGTCPQPPPPTDPCLSASRETRNFAEVFCSRYKQQPFKNCQDTVDVTKYFKDCMYDYCAMPGDTENICAAAAAYVKSCAEAGAPVEGWRTSNFCPMNCPDGFVFNGCGAGCHATCSDPEPQGCEDTCIEGCYCPPGTVLQDGQCIESSDCQCMFEGRFLENGQSWNDTVKCETCECADGGVIDCTPKVCDSCPAGQVPVSSVGSCCPFCLADWADEKEDTLEMNVNTGPATLECVLHDDVLVAPDAITWKYSSGEEITAENKPDNFQFSEDMLTLTINPAQITDENDYVAEVIYNGVVGACKFDLDVIPVPPKNLIDLEGDSPRTVKEGDCQTLSVNVIGDGDFSAEDFTWASGLVDTAVDFSNDKFTLLQGGKSLKICDAQDTDEGPYRVCVTEGDITDCVDVELQVLAVCEGDQERLEGETWKEGDYTECSCSSIGETECSCIEQEVTCEATEEGYYDEDCQFLCSRLPGNCLVTGDPHYKTFDGYRHDFQGGNCRFSLVKTEDFEVVGTNKHRDDNKNVAWNDAVEVFFQSIKLYLGPAGEVKVGDEAVILPYEKSFRGKGKTRESISVKLAGSTVVVKVMKANGLEALDLTWDGNSTVSSSIHGKYFEGTSGLCGSWDEDDGNEQGGADLNDFGWGNKYNDEVCEEEPQPEHPCDDTFFPAASPIADQACDVLEAAPFAACHALVDPEATIRNCKYDTCACYDAACACHSIKAYVKECQEKGVQGLEAWRDKASYCPLICEEGLVYEPCGSYCPPTCGDKTPECGKMAGQCNEGCFCPKGTYLLGGMCVAADECQCTFNGEEKEVGATWENENTCETCQCEGQGEVICVKTLCSKCKKTEMPVYEGDACCPDCVEQWLTAEPAEFTDVTQSSDLKISCQSLVTPSRVDWFFSSDEGATWTEIVRELNRLDYTIKDITSDNDGQYKCVARKRFRSQEAIITVKTKEAAQTCQVVAPENGIATPAGPEVNVGTTVAYKCKKGFKIKGKKKVKCEKDGAISGIAVCNKKKGKKDKKKKDKKDKTKKGKKG